MKKFFLGILTGSIITFGIFYFFVTDKNNDRESGLSELVELVKQQQAAKSKVQEALDSRNATLAGTNPLTIIVTPGATYYYFRDNDCSNMKEGDTASVHKMLAEQTAKQNDTRIIIKMHPHATYKNATGLLDAIARSGIQPGNYAEMDLTEKEINCIKSINK